MEKFNYERLCLVGGNQLAILLILVSSSALFKTMFRTNFIGLVVANLLSL